MANTDYRLISYLLTRTTRAGDAAQHSHTVGPHMHLTSRYGSVNTNRCSSPGRNLEAPAARSHNAGHLTRSTRTQGPKPPQTLALPKQPTQSLNMTRESRSGSSLARPQGVPATRVSIWLERDGLPSGPRDPRGLLSPELGHVAALN
jgi:hypothetical protein